MLKNYHNKDNAAPIFLASRDDGIGERLRAILNAMYLAKKTEGGFGFVWEFYRNYKQEINGVCVANISIAPKEEIFAKSFIDKYCLNGIFKSDNRKVLGITHKDISKIAQPPYEEDWGWHATQLRLDQVFHNIDTKKYRKDIKNLWNTIEFVPLIEDIFAFADTMSSDLIDFDALHLRIGDCIYKSNSCTLSAGVFDRVITAEVAIEIIDKTLKNNRQIILFSDDFQTTKVLKYEAASKFGWDSSRILIVDDLIANNSILKNNLTFRALFEIYLMSKSKNIYYGKISGFGNLAVLIGNAKEIPVYVDYSIKKRYDITQYYYKDILELGFHPYFKAFSSFQNYRLTSLNLKNISINKLETLIQKAILYHQNNYYYNILLIDIYIKCREFKKAQDLLKELLEKSHNKFLEALFSKNLNYICEKYFLTYMEYANYSPYFAYIASHIAYNTGRISLGLYYINLALQSMPNEILFKKYKEFILNSNKYVLVGSSCRMMEHLSYKLGKKMAENSNSLLGILKNPFDMLNIYFKHQKEKRNLNKFIRKNNLCYLTPKLSEYTDYQRAYNIIKSNGYYKLGNAFIKANKNWYKFGYIDFYKEAKKISKDHKKKI